MMTMRTPIYLNIILLVTITLVFSCGEKTSEVIDEKVGLNLDNIDSTQNPSEDFFMFVNGKWMEKTEIPGDQGRWGSFNELRESSNDVVLEVLKNAREDNNYDDRSDQRKAADFFDIGMDSMAAENFGIIPLKIFLEQIDAISNIDDLNKYIIHHQQYGGGAFFGFGIIPDLKKSDEMGAYLFSGGLGLPERDYYVKSDEKSEETRQEYLSYISRIFELAELGDEGNTAENILRIESRLAEATLTKEASRQIDTLYNKFTLSELKAHVPSVNWDYYLTEIGITDINNVIVTEPLFMTEYESIVNSVPLTEIKQYLRWQVINGNAQYLTHEIVQAPTANGDTEKGHRKWSPAQDNWRHLGPHVLRSFGEENVHSACEQRPNQPSKLGHVACEAEDPLGAIPCGHLGNGNGQAN